MPKKLFILLFLILPNFTLAQFLGNENISLSSQPTHPQPNEKVVIALDAYSFDTVGADITWSINDEIQEAARGLNKMEYTVGALGKKDIIRTKITLRNGESYTATHTINPSKTNLTIEADTHTPYFYQGRREPSIGSTIKAIAIPETDLGYRPDEYTYRWEIDDEVPLGGPVKGRNVIEFKPSFGREVKIRLDVLNSQNGDVLASSLEYIPLSEPEIWFYKDSLLNGQSHVAFGSEYNLIEEEISIIAEPFFMNKNDLLTNSKLIWKLDGQNINNPDQNPFKITLRDTGGAGTANLFFSIRNLSSLTQFGQNNLSVRF